jgi:integrase
MASIFQQGKRGIWWIKYYANGTQVHRSLKTTNAREALQAKRLVEGDDARGDLLAPSKTRLPEFLENFCRFLSTVRTRKSFSADISCLRIFFGPVCPSLELDSHVNRRWRKREPNKIPDSLAHRHVKARYLEDITAARIEDFLAQRIREDGIAPKTANRTREILHRLFKYASKKWRYVSPDRRTPNPAAAVDRRPEPAPIITWLTQEQIDEQLRALANWSTLRAMVATYIYAGLRREEALWLTHSDVDLEARMIHVRAKEIDGEFWQPKTKRNRSVPISQTLLEALRGYPRPTASKWFFPAPTGGHWDPDNFSQDLQEINEAAGLNWSCLDFRHTFGSHLAQKGESLFKIAELMGNSPEICRRHYAALVPEKMRDTVEFAKPPVNDASGDGSALSLVKQLLDKIERLEAEKREQQPEPRLRIAR